MKVVIITGIYPPMVGGAGAVMKSLAEAAPDQIAVITCEYDADGNRILLNGADPKNVTRISRLAHKLGALPGGKARAVVQAAYNRFLLFPRLTRELLRSQDQLRPDAVCIGTLSSCYWVVPVLRRLRPQLRILVYVHGEEVPRRNDGYASSLRLAALHSASKLIAVSSFTKGALVREGIPAEKVAVIRNGVDTQRFQPGNKSERIINKFNLAGRRILMTLARLDERKGHDMLLRALPTIHAAIPDVMYLIVGEGSYEPALRRLVAELQLHDVVVFAGPAQEAEVADFYRTCDVYAMPNRTTAGGDTEGFGLVFLEAGACGKPVIGGIAGGVPDAIVDEATGLLVDGTSPDAIAKACIRLLSDAELCHRLGAEGIQHARRNQWSTKTQEFLSLCQETAAE